MKTIIKLIFCRLKYQKSKTILTSISIIIATMLISAIGTAVQGLQYLNKEIALNDIVNYHARFYDISEKDINLLKEDSQIESITMVKWFGTVFNDDINAVLSMNEDILPGIVGTVYKEGTAPKLANEIAGPEDFFTLLGFNAQVGEKIELSFRLNNEGKVIKKEFVITGLLEQKNTNNMNINKKRYVYSGIVSKNLVEQHTNINDKNYDILIRVQGQDNLDYDEICNKIYNVAKTINYSDKSVIINKAFVKASTDAGIETKIIAFLIGAIVIVFSGSVLYCIYCTKMTQDIQDIGRLRAIGAEKTQIKKMLYMENIFLGLICIPIGLLSGYFLSWYGLKILYCFYPSVDFSINLVSNTLLILVYVSVMLMIILCLIPCIKKIMKISPAENIIYQSQDISKSVNRNGFKSITISGLVCINLLRNKKNIISTIIPLALSCTLFIGVSGLLNSIDLGIYVTETIPEGQFNLELNFSYDDKEFHEKNLNFLQGFDIMGEKLISQIREIDGVTHLKERFLSLGDISYPATDFDKRRVTIGTYSPDDEELLQPYLEKGTLDYYTLKRNNGIIYTYDHAFEKNGFNIGDSFEISFLDGENNHVVPVKLMASTKSMEKGTFLIPEDMMKEIFEDTSPTYAFSIFVENENYDTVKPKLQQLAESESYFTLYSLDEEKAFGKRIVNTIKYPVYFICILLGIIAMINVINTFIISIIRRKREIAFLRCIGLSKKQLYHLLLEEALVIFCSSFIISLVLGGLIGYGVVEFAKNNSWVGIQVYTYPFLETCGLFFVFLIIQCIIIIFMNRHLCSESITEQLRRSCE